MTLEAARIPPHPGPLPEERENRRPSVGLLGAPGSVRHKSQGQREKPRGGAVGGGTDFLKAARIPPHPGPLPEERENRRPPVRVE